MSKRNPIPPRRSLGGRPTAGPDLTKGRRDRGEPPQLLPKSASLHLPMSASSCSHASSCRSQDHVNHPSCEKSLEFPRTNSSRSQEKMIEKAIHDISKLPERIEQAVSRKVSQVEFQKNLTHKVTMIPN